MSRDGEEGFCVAAAHAKMPAISAVMQRRAKRLRDGSHRTRQRDRTVRRTSGRAWFGAGRAHAWLDQPEDGFQLRRDDKIVLDACVAAEMRCCRPSGCARQADAGFGACPGGAPAGRRAPQPGGMVRLRDGLG